MSHTFEIGPERFLINRVDKVFQTLNMKRFPKNSIGSTVPMTRNPSLISKTSLFTGFLGTTNWPYWGPRYLLYVSTTSLNVFWLKIFSKPHTNCLVASLVKTCSNKCSYIIRRFSDSTFEALEELQHAQSKFSIVSNCLRLFEVNFLQKTSLLSTGEVPASFNRKQCASL